MNAKKYLIMITAVILGLAGITIAYAALSQQLTVTVNKVTQTAQTWNVALTTGTLTATVEGTGDTGRNCGTATATATATAHRVSRFVRDTMRQRTKIGQYYIRRAVHANSVRKTVVI